MKEIDTTNMMANEVRVRIMNSPNQSLEGRDQSQEDNQSRKKAGHQGTIHDSQSTKIFPTLSKTNYANKLKNDEVV